MPASSTGTYPSPPSPSRFSLPNHALRNRARQQADTRVGTRTFANDCLAACTIPVSHPISATRARRQGGNELIEFALVLALLGPLFLWVFVNSMNLLRMIQTNQICRDIGNLYIHGMDFSTYLGQSVAQRLAQGYGLNAGSSFSGNNATNDGNPGNGWAVLSEVMFVGTGSCSTLPQGTTCTNQNQYVYLQRFDFGNRSVVFNGTGVASQVGTPTATINTSGYVQNYLTDAGAQAPNFSRFMQTQLVDGQIIYVCETFFASPDLGFSSYPGGGVYSRTFF